MAVIKNKELVQSYIMSTAKYDFSIYEKRILYRIIEVLQAKLLGLKLNYTYSIQECLYGDNTEFTFDIKAFLKDENDNNYNEVKNALKSLRKKDFEYEDASEWGIYGIIDMAKIKKYSSTATIKVTPLVLEAFMNFAKGYRKFELTTSMQLGSIYSMRFYELLNKQKTPITYTIDQLRSMFKLEKKYKDTNKFITKTVLVAKTELDKKSQYSFEFQLNKIGKKIHSITFFPTATDEAIEQKMREQSPKTISPELRDYLTTQIGFTPNEIKANKELFFRAELLLPDIILQLQTLKGKSRRSQNPKGWIIGAIKNTIEKQKEQKNHHFFSLRK